MVIKNNNNNNKRTVANLENTVSAAELKRFTETLQSA